jgi:Tfp pilus assembly protein PilZ
MTSTAEQVEKQTIVLRLAVSIYKMNDHQLGLVLDALERQAGAEHGPSGDAPLRHPRENSDAIGRQMMIARIFVLLHQLDKNALLHRLFSLDDPAFKWVRRYPRLACDLLVDFAAGGKAYRSYIRDISASGVFIETSDKFERGQEVALCFTLSGSSEILPFKIKGRVTRVHIDGIGVQYEEMNPYRREILDTLINRIGRPAAGRQWPPR